MPVQNKRPFGPPLSFSSSSSSFVLDFFGTSPALVASSIFFSLAPVRQFEATPNPGSRTKDDHDDENDYKTKQRNKINTKILATLILSPV